MRRSYAISVIALVLVAINLFVVGCGCNKEGGQIDVNNPGNTAQPSGTEIPIHELDGHDDVTPAPLLSYEEYRALNSDVIGWIKIENTKVNYPLVKCPDGDENKYYLNHSVERNNSKSGAIFLDYRCDVKSKHKILFGHNMRSGTMFADVNNYSNASFYNSHRTFSVKFGDTDYTYKVFAAYDTHVNDARYMKVDFKSDAGFAGFMNDLANLSMYPVDMRITESDEVITLSTCNHSNYQNGRFVVHAVRVD